MASLKVSVRPAHNKPPVDFNVRPYRTPKGEYRHIMRQYRHLVAVKPGSPSGAAVVIQ